MKSVHVGVDISKEKLDVYVPAVKEGDRPTTTEVNNSIEGFRKLRDLARRAKATVCVEPTGGYELELIAFMHKFDVVLPHHLGPTITVAPTALSRRSSSVSIICGKQSMFHLILPLLYPIASISA